MLVVSDGATMLIQALDDNTPNLINKSLGKAGYILRQEMVRRGRSAGRGDTSVKFKNGHRRLSFGRKPVFSRWSHSSRRVAKPSRMTDLIRYKVYEKSGKMLVGFMNVKGFSMTKYDEAGNIIGKYARTKGTGGGKSGIDFKSIGQQLEYGGKVSLSSRQRTLFRYSGWGMAASRGYVMKKAHPVINPSFRAKKTESLESFKITFDKTLKAMQRRAS